MWVQSLRRVLKAGECQDLVFRLNDNDVCKKLHFEQRRLYTRSW